MQENNYILYMRLCLLRTFPFDISRSIMLFFSHNALICDNALLSSDIYKKYRNYTGLVVKLDDPEDPFFKFAPVKRTREEEEETTIEYIYQEKIEHVDAHWLAIVRKKPHVQWVDASDDDDDDDDDDLEQFDAK